MKISSRQTGRTTRMLEDAIKHSNEGKTVCVITANHRERERISELLKDHPEIKVDTPYSRMLFNWNTLTYEGMNSDDKFLIDHFAIEDKFSKILDMLHKYDKEEKPDEE